mgnify:CR=1 FL=1
MRQLILFVTVLFSLVSYAGDYSTSETSIGTLLDDPAAAEIIEKHMPGITANDQISMARSLTLVALQGFAPDMVTDEALKKIDADLKNMSAGE